MGAAGAALNDRFDGLGAGMVGASDGKVSVGQDSKGGKRRRLRPLFSCPSLPSFAGINGPRTLDKVVFSSSQTNRNKILVRHCRIQNDVRFFRCCSNPINQPRSLSPFPLSSADVLDSVLFRVGLLAALRSKSLDGDAIGVMVTASHNPEKVRSLSPGPTRTPPHNTPSMNHRTTA